MASSRRGTSTAASRRRTRRSTRGGGSAPGEPGRGGGVRSKCARERKSARAHARALDHTRRMGALARQGRAGASAPAMRAALTRTRTDRERGRGDAKVAIDTRHDAGGSPKYSGEVSAPEKPQGAPLYNARISANTIDDSRNYLEENETLRRGKTLNSVLDGNSTYYRANPTKCRTRFADDVVHRARRVR
jgi:hypothetical protein